MKKIHTRWFYATRIISLGLLLASCENFLNVDLPTTLVPQDRVFGDDITATSAVKGLYVDLLDINGFSSGSNVCAATLTGLSSDELHNYVSSIDYVGFEQNNIQADNFGILNLWSSAYRTIYDANSAIEGLQNSTGLTSTVRDQLIGEALFVRAYCHFYLVNLFGAVPLIKTTNYQNNAKAVRTPVVAVYDQITADLQQSRILLSDAYQGAPDRIRINKSTATAFLARVSLYIKDWQTAESLATVLIENKSVYELAPDLNNVFLAGSKEAIWQMRLPDTALKSYTTYEGRFFIIASNFDLNYNVLSDTLYNTFEPNDLRKTNWIGSYLSGTDTVYFPRKYKIKYGSLPAKENSTVLRLAEQFLIRAEARAMQNKLSSAIDDVDVLRKRAKLLLIQDTNPNISRDDLLLAIEQERRVELFTEGAHRWFDLIRTDRAEAVFGSLKPTWDSRDALYPLPQSELVKNPNLRNQNPGY